ncbi:hypothetical protein EZ449_05775 [Pedobacter frigidisoli]|uniref:Uncharacterized protein n=1 Tax=Pedobacter frigidisoli TaxID=2530455 RepID=A0A4R0P6B0_9SPHI|nr:hypothetical protein [Pedobacter frigidisoli]TCD11008.1 hypothetical protein EZ449_05775 [Pedobacter frigidisoli]
MKNPLLILILLVTLVCKNPARAKKSYDLISYKSIIDGSQATLKLAYGYLLASKITIRTKVGEQVFTPLANEPDLHGELRFERAKSTRKHMGNSGSWLTLKKLNDAEYPSQIKAVYRDGKVQKVVVFKQQN